VDRQGDPRDLEAEGLPAVEDQPAGVSDLLDGIVPPRDRPLVSGGDGVTAAEQRTGETISQRATREVPEGGYEDDEALGRLVQPDQGVAGLDVEADELATEVPDVDGLSAEEQAVRPTDSP
jgi:Family of unknown function (DUF5709)